MRLKKPVLLVLILLTIINICVFVLRDRFRYQDYVDDRSLYKPCGSRCEEKWQHIVYDYPAAEFTEARLIAASLISDSSTTLKKILSLGHSLRRRFEKQLGRPTDSLMGTSPLNQYKQLSEDTSTQLWCGNFAQIFSYFCWTQGITNRVIEIMRSDDRHVVNECYLPETGQWMLVDLTNNLLAVTSGTPHGLFQLVSLRKAVLDKRHIEAWRSFSDSILLVQINATELEHYYKASYPAFFYKSMDYYRELKPINKVKNYLLPVSWYEILVEKERNNLLFYLKLVLITLWLASFFVFLLSRTKFKI